MTPEQIEQVDESDAQIVALVGEMAAQVDEAHATTCRAIATLYRLTSNAVFDIELIEATLGDDAEAELATAARALRNAAGSSPSVPRSWTTSRTEAAGSERQVRPVRRRCLDVLPRRRHRQHLPADPDRPGRGRPADDGPPGPRLVGYRPRSHHHHRPQACPVEDDRVPAPRPLGRVRAVPGCADRRRVEQPRGRRKPAVGPVHGGHRAAARRGHHDRGAVAPPRRHPAPGRRRPHVGAAPPGRAPEPARVPPPVPGYMPGFREHIKRLAERHHYKQFVFLDHRGQRGISVTLQVPFDQPITEYRPPATTTGRCRARGRARPSGCSRGGSCSWTSPSGSRARTARRPPPAGTS